MRRFYRESGVCAVGVRDETGLENEAKHTRSGKVEVGLIFDFQRGEKPQMYPLRYIEDFFRAEYRRATQDPRSQQGGVLPPFPSVR